MGDGDLSRLTTKKGKYVVVVIPPLEKSVHQTETRLTRLMIPMTNGQTMNPRNSAML